jgi:anti-sigma B factor antagonist
VNELATLTLELRDGVQVAHIAGEVDIANAAALEAEIAEAVSNAADGLVIDLTETEYFDSAGVRLLFELHGRLAGRRQVLRVVVPHEAVILSALRITEVDQVVPIDATVDEALAALSPDG